MALNPKVLKQLFPQDNVKFAMFGDYVNRYERQMSKNVRKPEYNLIEITKTRSYCRRR